MSNLIAVILGLALMFVVLTSGSRPEPRPKSLDEACDIFADRVREVGVRVDVEKGKDKIVVTVHRP